MILFFKRQNRKKNNIISMVRGLNILNKSIKKYNDKMDKIEDNENNITDKKNIFLILFFQ